MVPSKPRSSSHTECTAKVIHSEHTINREPRRSVTNAQALVDLQLKTTLNDLCVCFCNLFQLLTVCLLVIDQINRFDHHNSSHFPHGKKSVRPGQNVDRF